MKIDLGKILDALGGIVNVGKVIAEEIRRNNLILMRINRLTDEDLPETFDEIAREGDEYDDVFREEG